ncbi:MAG: hypothetical protein EX272_03100 [Chromatiales bacterium]|nr:MAG: hypothetical protein EX272_03100 [Chromatiales bacterium]
MSVRYAQLLVRNRWAILVMLAALTVLSIIAISRIEFDNSVESWFLDTDPSLATYNRFTETFRSDQIVIAGIFADDVLSPDVLVAVDRISAAAARLRFADDVQSLTHSAAVRRIGGIDAPEYRSALLASPLQRALLLSPDNTATAIVIHYAREGDTFAHKHEFVSGLRSIVREATAGTDIQYAIAGGPVLGEAGARRNSQDLRILVPAMILVIAVFAYGLVQSLRLTLIPLGVVGIAVVMAHGLMVAAGWKMTVISVVLIPLILAVGVAHSIHLIARYVLNLESGLDNRAAVIDSVERLLKPCFYTSITTVIGLLSLLVSELKPVHEFAITAAVGVFAAFVVSVTFLPIMLLMRRTIRSRRSTVARSIVQRLLRVVHSVASKHPRRIVLLALLTGVGFIWQATRVESGLDPMSWIRHDDPIRVDTLRIDNAFGGALSLEFLLSSPEGLLNKPEVLRRTEDLQHWLVANTTIGRATSVADFVKEAARIARDAGDEGFALPRTRFLTNELLARLRDDAQLDAWVTPDFTQARIAARVPLTSAQEIVDQLPAIDHRIAQTFGGSGVTVEMTGQAVLASRMQSHLLDSQLRSFSVALAVVSLIMIVLLRSALLGLVAMVPNLLPIAIGLGAMTILDIPLNPATVTIAAVALGIVVDDTVHLMTAFDRHFRSTGRVGASVRAMLLEVGQPVMVTSVLLASGFATLILGGFLPTRQVGGLIALIAVAALVSDLIFLPAILRSIPGRWLRARQKSEPSGPVK